MATLYQLYGHNAIIKKERVKESASNIVKCEKDIFTLEMLRSQIKKKLMRLVPDKGEKMEK